MDVSPAARPHPFPQLPGSGGCRNVIQYVALPPHTVNSPCANLLSFRG